MRWYLHRRKPIAVLIGTAVLLLITWQYAMQFIAIVLGVIAVVSTTFSFLEYRWRTFTSNTPEARKKIGFPEPIPHQSSDDYTFFTLILPAYNEAGVIGHTLENLAQQDYPSERFEVLVTLRDDDP